MGDNIHSSFIDTVVSESETAVRTNVSPSTLRRLNARGEGPPRLQLSHRRVGYLLSDVKKWLELKARLATAKPVNARTKRRGAARNQ